MKIAFDVMGTLVGPKGEQLKLILLESLEKGHEVTVWSNSYSYAIDYVKKEGLEGKVKTKSKYSKMDIFEGYEDGDKSKPIYNDDFYDLAIDDDPYQSYLAAKQFIVVDKVTIGSLRKLIL